MIQPPCLRLRSVAKRSKPMGNLTRTTKHKSTISKIKEHYSKVVRCYFHVKRNPCTTCAIMWVSMFPVVYRKNNAFGSNCQRSQSPNPSGSKRLSEGHLCQQTAFIKVAPQLQLGPGAVWISGTNSNETKLVHLKIDTKKKTHPWKL